MNLLIDGATALFSGLVDYAGVFPPTSQSLEDAVDEYRTARQGPHQWMLGRFLCRSSQLEELAGLLTRSMVVGELPWRVSAIVDQPPGIGALHAQVFDRHMDPASTIELAEVRLPEDLMQVSSDTDAVALIGPVAAAVSTISPGVLPFLEVPHAPDPTAISHAVRGIAAVKTKMVRPMGATLRMGGRTADARPSSPQIASFLMACHEYGLPCKASGGLHHPVSQATATDPDIIQHGFLNLLTAAAAVQTACERAIVISILDEKDPSAFAVSAGGLRWGDMRFAVPTLRTMRSGLCIAFGSCSFDEPVTDLRALGMVK